MHLLSVVLMVVATLAASNSPVSAAGATGSTKIWPATVQDPIRTIDASHTETIPKRMLRGVSNGGNGVDGYAGRRLFYEDTVKNQLAELTTQLSYYRRWYNDGITSDQVTEYLKKSESGELYDTYQILAQGYEDYIKRMQHTDKPSNGF